VAAQKKGNAQGSNARKVRSCLSRGWRGGAERRKSKVTETPAENLRQRRGGVARREGGEITQEFREERFYLQLGYAFFHRTKRLRVARQK